jgi:signal transduction histidine kinase
MDDDDAITFPDAPRGELDRALTDLVDRARDVLQTQGRLRALVKANQAVVSHLDLPVVLRTIVEAAVELVGAQYGALGVVAPNGGLEQFIHVGMTPRQVDEIGHLPEGHGLLGALVDDPQPIRIDRISDDPRSVGFPAGHPGMDSFLGVPIRVRDFVYGNLYLTNHAHGAFTGEDEQLVGAFAATAGFAIDNARLFAETEARRAWSAAASEVTSALLSGESEDALTELVESVERLSAASFVGVLTPEPEGEAVMVHVARGEGAAELAGQIRPLSGDFLAGAIESGKPRVADGLDGVTLSADGVDWGPALVVPLQVNQETRALLVVLRSVGAPAFTSFDLERVADISGQAGIVIELAAARADRQRMLLLEDRTRIARDLHDHVIQQLFATGLELQSLETVLGPGTVADRLDASAGAIDAAIAQIRTVIFALSRQSAGATTVRHRILDLADEAAPMLVRPATVAFSGPVDLIVSAELAEDVIAVVREGLTNVARHANAQHTAVNLEVANSLVTLTIADDGIGLGGNTRRSGLKNGAERATQHGGTLSIDSDPNGTLLTWSVPIPDFQATP